LSLAFVLVSYGALYLAIAKVDPTAFKDGTVKTFADAIWFSVGVFFTAAFGDIVPVSAFAKLAVVTEIATALVMISLLALSYSRACPEILKVLDAKMDRGDRQVAANP
jgi:Ion channel